MPCCDRRRIGENEVGRGVSLIACYSSRILVEEAGCSFSLFIQAARVHPYGYGLWYWGEQNLAHKITAAYCCSPPILSVVKMEFLGSGQKLKFKKSSEQTLLKSQSRQLCPSTHSPRSLLIRSKASLSKMSSKTTTKTTELDEEEFQKSMKKPLVKVMKCLGRVAAFLPSRSLSQSSRFSHPTTVLRYADGDGNRGGRSLYNSTRQVPDEQRLRGSVGANQEFS